MEEIKEGALKFVDKEIYFKEENGKKHIGRITKVLHEEKDAIIIEIKCNENMHKVLYDNEKQIEDCIGIAERVLEERLKLLDRFFSNKKNLKPKVKTLKSSKPKKRLKK